jgi:hypothetical protein
LGERRPKIIPPSTASVALILSLTLPLGLAPGLGAAPAVNGFVPTDLDHLEFFVVSTDFGPQAIATCNTQACYDEPFTEIADISRLYCDTVPGAIPGAVGYAPEGCVRWWEDQGPFDCGLCGTGEQDDEWVRGHRHGQDDLQKPALVTDCLNGQPCARLPRVSEMGPNATQIACHELENDDSLEIAGAFSAILLVAPRDQAEDWWYFGAPNNGLLHSVMNDSLFFRASSSELMPITVAGAVDPSGGVWQLIEVYRNGAGRIEVWVDGEEVTAPGPPTNGQILVHRYLGAQNCNGATEGLVGDLAAFLLFSDRLTVAERVQLRDWFEATYQLSRVFDDGFESGDTAAWSRTVGGAILPP